MKQFMLYFFSLLLGAFIVLQCSAPTVTNSCEKASDIPGVEQIWSLNERWSYAPVGILSQDACQGAVLEYHYVHVHANTSHIAMKNVPTTKESSCKNQALFEGKEKLFDSMVGSAISELPEGNELSVLQKRELYLSVYGNNRSSKQTGFIECKPTGAQNTESSEAWNSCECVLYGYFPQGKSGMVEEVSKIKKKNISLSYQ